MKKYFSSLLLGLGFVCFAQTDYSFVYDSSQFIREGNDLHDAQKYEEAIRKYEQINPIDPLYKNALYEKAMTYAYQKKEDEARKIYEKAYADGLMANDTDFLMSYGSFLSDHKEYDKAEQLFKESEKLAPNAGPLLYNMALLYVRKQERQKSIDVLKKSVTLNPNHAGSHYLLGLIALEEGHVVEGSLALLSYLVIAPDGGGAEQAILKLNAKFGENYLSQSNLVFSEKGDDFSEIQEILRNQLALKSAYKVKSEIDDVITRQMQALIEYFPEHKYGEGFFETTYGPWLSEMARKNQFEGFSYYMLLSMEQKLGSKITSQKKKISAFKANFIETDFWPVFAKRTLDVFGEKKEVVIYLKAGKSSFIGATVKGLTEGKSKSLYANGNLLGELNFVGNELDGVQKYYDEKGNLYEEKGYSKGVLDGKRTVYYPNGNIKTIENYKNGKLDGLSNSYYVNGGKACEVNFIDDERDGKMTCLYENGKTKSEATYIKGKLDGSLKTFNALGELISDSFYKTGEVSGSYTEYFDGKSVKTQTDYSGGKIQSHYKVFYADGSLKEDYTYANGVLKNDVHYLENGDKSYETRYDDKQEVANYTYFDIDGNKFYEELFKDGQIKSGLQYQAGKAEPIPMDIAKKGHDLKNLDGVTTALGKYEKGKKIGQWQYFYSNGNLREKEIFDKGAKTGLQHVYERNGRPMSISHYVNDSLSGIYESYRNGKLYQSFSYRKDERNGPSTTYYADGSVSSVSFYKDGELVKNVEYWQNGQPNSIVTYNEGTTERMESFDLTGKKQNSFDYSNKTGKTTLTFYGGNILHELNLVNGMLQGAYIIKEKSGKPWIVAEYANGDKQNHYKKYGPTGDLYVDLNFHDGVQHGLNRYYDLAGTLRFETDFVFGEETGNSSHYFYNGTKMSTYKQFDENREGETTYYNLKGEPILILGFDYDILKYYIALDPSGKLSQKVPVVKETATIISAYPNKKTAMELTFKKGEFDGKMMIYAIDGKPEFEAIYDNGQLNGIRTAYYANGKIYKKENFVDGREEGLSEYFKEDGKPWLTAISKNDELHGPCKVYANGTIITKTYDSDILLETK
ncbi:tetratricopeptide repeat protein [Flavobacterium sp. MAH-1]|uniref:Tetratricopeptide repeat protein n=1 Tax=Flavobacterium agri TaxID=2743471 RepID=A0A7Y8Y1B7_9FLAO|nr:toxin-antitoxin system YwqK family antitoxin [Flavobacterium agri]NUY80709.1 tetratricopeptide repeat protein [Flavobacterium agri]NYA70733.1 tetratricopeptide repeat protein [Flavobacterium agri]